MSKPFIILGGAAGNGICGLCRKYYENVFTYDYFDRCAYYTCECEITVLCLNMDKNVPTCHKTITKTEVKQYYPDVDVEYDETNDDEIWLCYPLELDNELFEDENEVYHYFKGKCSNCKQDHIGCIWTD